MERDDIRQTEGRPTFKKGETETETETETESVSEKGREREKERDDNQTNKRWTHI